MQNNLITTSIIDKIYKIINKQQANIIYLDSGSMFDKLVIDSLPHNVFVHKKLEDVDFSLTTYDLCMGSDPVYHSQNQNQLSTLQIPSIVTIHNKPPHNIKKEDKFLLGRYLNNTKKIFFDIDIANDWSIGHDHIIDYGFPSNINNTSKLGSIVVLNSNNLRQINILYQSIKNTYNDCSLLSYGNFSSVSEIISELSKYKIAISIENIYDSIVCGLAGCYTITTQKNKYLDLCVVSDFNKIYETIDDGLTKTISPTHNVFRETQDMILDFENIIYKQRLL